MLCLMYFKQIDLSADLKTAGEIFPRSGLLCRIGALSGVKVQKKYNTLPRHSLHSFPDLKC